MARLSNVNPVSASDFRLRARRYLPGFLFDYVDGAANDEQTARWNEQAFDRYRLKQLVMKDVSSVDTSVTLLGKACAMPLALAPVGMAGMMARRGEVQGARAAKTAGIPFTTSTLGVCDVDEIRDATATPPWFQLYMLRDRDVVLSLLERARAAGCDTLLFTVDLAVPGIRLRDFRNGMIGSDIRSRIARAMQLAIRPRWAVEVGLLGRPHAFGMLREVVDNPEDIGSYRAFVESQFDPSVTWADIRWLREQWQGKLVIKGVMEPEDAREAVGCGADGIVVSNHGGRQLDGVDPTLEKLAAAAGAVPGAAVLLDGGVRNGIDVVKALALGAHGVLMGRPWIWAVAGAGESGLRRYLELTQREVATAMALMGVTRVQDIGPEHLYCTATTDIGGGRG